MMNVHAANFDPTAGGWPGSSVTHVVGQDDERAVPYWPTRRFFSSPHVTELSLDPFCGGDLIHAATIDVRTGVSRLAAHSTVDGTLYSRVAAHPPPPPPTTSGGRLKARRSSSSSSSSRDGGIGGLFRLGRGATSWSAIENDRDVGGLVGSVSPRGVRVHSRGGGLVSRHAWRDDAPRPSRTACSCSLPDSSWLAASGTTTREGGLDDAPTSLSLFDVSVPDSAPVVVVRVASGVRDVAVRDDAVTLVLGLRDGRLVFRDARRPDAVVADRESGHGPAVGGVAAVACRRHLVATIGCDHAYAPQAPHHVVRTHDARMLGRGGVPYRLPRGAAAPRRIAFLEETASPTLAVCCGHEVRLIRPDRPATEEGEEDVVVRPPLNMGDDVRALEVGDDGDFWIGTDFGELMHFRKNSTFWASRRDNSSTLFTPEVDLYQPKNMNRSKPPAPVEIPSFQPPPLPISPRSLAASSPHLNPFTSYTVLGRPTVTRLDATKTGDPLVDRTMLATPRRVLSNVLLEASSKGFRSDFVVSVPASDLSLDLVAVSSSSSSFGGTNPNQCLGSIASASKCYDLYADPRKKKKERGAATTAATTANDGVRDRAAPPSDVAPSRNASACDDDDDDPLPERYRRRTRATCARAGMVDTASFNSTNLWPGWDDFGGNVPNAHAAPLTVILYFVPELRRAFRSRQFDPSSSTAPVVSVELGRLFHQIDARAAHALTHVDARVDAFHPSFVTSSLHALPQASASDDDDDPARRLASCWRFLVHRLDTENNGLLDGLFGADSTSVNEFVDSGSPPSVKRTRSLTAELCYDSFLGRSDDDRPSFGEMLRRSLCKETRLRAWCDGTREYETVSQRRVATSLSKLLSISCVGKKGEEVSSFWTRKGGWLPDTIEIELRPRAGADADAVGGGGNVVVRELVRGTWWECDGTRPAKTIADPPPSLDADHVVRYELVAVVSFVRSRGEDDRSPRHSVAHVRVPKRLETEMLSAQARAATDCTSASEALEAGMERVRASLAQSAAGSGGAEDDDVSLVLPPLTLSTRIPSAELRRRAETVAERARKLRDDGDGDSWILVNGIVVTRTNAEDATDFCPSFREPCLLMYRDANELDDAHCESPEDEGDSSGDIVPTEVMETPSLTTGLPPNTSLRDLPGKGDLVAIDTEFVLVQREDYVLDENGTKVVVAEGRHSLARVSVIDCRTGVVVVDDHVLPQERIVDYLTRFSGIRPSDLDPKYSPHHLVTMRTAYLKLRLLLNRGCVFVGHGLDKDFRMLNIFVPSQQTIDTVTIFRRDGGRMISLRFLANYLLGRDMQQDTHDSIEDARTAYWIYREAVELKKSGRFERVLGEIYELGRKNEWKLNR